MGIRVTLPQTEQLLALILLVSLRADDRCYDRSDGRWPTYRRKKNYFHLTLTLRLSWEGNGYLIAHRNECACLRSLQRMRLPRWQYHVWYSTIITVWCCRCIACYWRVSSKFAFVEGDPTGEVRRSAIRCVSFCNSWPATNDEVYLIRPDVAGGRSSNHQNSKTE